MRLFINIHTGFLALCRHTYMYFLAMRPPTTIKTVCTYIILRCTNVCRYGITYIGCSLTRLRKTPATTEVNMTRPSSYICSLILVFKHALELQEHEGINKACMNNAYMYDNRGKNNTTDINRWFRLIQLASWLYLSFLTCSCNSSLYIS